MKKFLFVYRAENRPMSESTPEQGEAVMKQWMEWLEGIAKKGNLVDKGNSLKAEGKVVRPNKIVTDGPYTEMKELIGGFSIVKTESFDEAAELAKDCPIFAVGGNVEVREIN